MSMDRVMKPCNFTFALRHCSNVDRYSIAAEDAIAQQHTCGAGETEAQRVATRDAGGKGRIGSAHDRICRG